MANMEEIKRLNEEQRGTIKRLKQDLEEEKKKIKELKDDKLREVRAAREAEQTKSNAEKEELRQKLERQHQEDSIKRMDEEQTRHRTEVERMKRSHANELQAQAKRLENERKEGEERVRSEVTEKLTDELGSSHDSKVKKLTTSLFKNEEKMNELEDRIENLLIDNTNLKTAIQAKDKENEKTIENLRRQSKMESQQQIEEIKQKERELQEKVKELAAMSRKWSEVQAAKEKLEYKMELQRQSATIKVPPTSLTPSKKGAGGGMGEIVEESVESFIAHTKASHSELLLKNSELGYLVHTLQKEIDSLSKEKITLEKKVNVMEEEIGPLKERHQDNLMKIHKLRSDVNTKQRQLEKVIEEKAELEIEKAATLKKFTDEHERIKSRDKRITELQRAKDEREKELRTMKRELEHYKETAASEPTQSSTKDSNSKTLELQRTRRLLREKDKELNALKEEFKNYREKKTDKLTVASLPSPLISSGPPTPSNGASPSPTKRISDNTIANQRSIEHKKRKELEHQIEDLSSQLQEKAQTNFKRIEDLNLSIKRRDKQIKMLSTENHKLKSTNQLLQESREREKRERVHDWSDSRSDLERAHAQINKLQQQKSDLQDEVVLLKRQSPSPDGTGRDEGRGRGRTSPHQRMLSPQPRSLSSSKTGSTSPRARSVSPQPRTSRPNMTSSPIPLVLPSPSTGHPSFSTSKPLYESFEEEDFGSQWSLVSSESILKEQLEQMEFDKDEVNIQYEELKKEYGQTKGKYNILRERYKSLLARSKSIHSKLQQREKERLNLEKELTLLQEEAKNEFDIKRESNLRERLDQSLQRIAELEAIMEEQFNKSGKDDEQIEIEKEKNRELIAYNEELLQQLEEQKEAISKLEESVTELEREGTISNTHQRLKQLEVELEDSRGHLEGEKAVVASLKHQIQTLREEGTYPLLHPPSPSLSTSRSLQPKLMDCLVSMNDVTQKMKQVVQTDPTESSSTITQGHLIQQLEDKLSEANGLITGHTPSPSKRQLKWNESEEEEEDGEEGFEETDAPLMGETSFGNKNEKFQEWLSQFQKEKNVLKSKIEHLEERLSDGSNHVSQLKNLVIELESRLKNEQDLHVSLLAERDEQISSLSNRLELTQGLKQRVMTALNDTNEAVEQQNIAQIQIEMDKLDRLIREMLLLAPSRDSTPFPSYGRYQQQEMITPQMMSPVVPISSPPQSTEVSFSMSPPLSPFKSLSPACSYPTITPIPSEGPPLIMTTQPPPPSVFSSRTQNKPRLYVTLFDYNPKSLCSTGHPEKELDLNTGDVISVVGDMNTSGYYTAEFEGRRGLVPAAFIQEMNINDKEAQQRLLNQSLTHSNATSRVGSEVDLIPPLRKVASNRPAPPTSFQVEKFVGTSSLLVTWVPPLLDTNGQSNGCIVTGYCLLCDENMVLHVSTPLATQGVIRDIDLSMSHLLGIFTVSANKVPSLVTTFQYTGVAIQRMVALYDYDPDIDSPNATPGVELDFEKGDVIVVFGEIRRDGFYNGEINGRYGLVPSNFLTPQDNSLTSRDDSMEQPTLTTRVEVEDSKLQGSSTPELTAKKHVRAVYTYNPHLSSPNKKSTSLELEFEKGDILTVYGEKRKDGFYNGEINGQCGLVPSNFVVEIEPHDTPTLQVATPTRQPPTADIST